VHKGTQSLAPQRQGAVVCADLPSKAGAAVVVVIMNNLGLALKPSGSPVVVVLLDLVVVVLANKSD
jgi:hypothetical protein